MRVLVGSTEPNCTGTTACRARPARRATRLWASRSAGDPADGRARSPADDRGDPPCVDELDGRVVDPGQVGRAARGRRPRRRTRTSRYQVRRPAVVLPGSRQCVVMQWTAGETTTSCAGRRPLVVIVVARRCVSAFFAPLTAPLTLLAGAALLHVADDLVEGLAAALLEQVEPVGRLREAQVGVDAGDHDAGVDGQQLDADEGDPDVGVDDDALVEDDLDDVGQAARARGARGSRRRCDAA